MRQVISSIRGKILRMMDHPDVFFDFKAGDHQFMTAAQAPEPQIRSRTKDPPAFISAGMCLLHREDIVQFDLHGTSQWLIF